MKRIVSICALCAATFTVLLSSCRKDDVAPPSQLVISNDASDLDRIYTFPMTSLVAKGVEVGSIHFDPQGTTMIIGEFQVTMVVNNYFNYYGAFNVINTLYAYDGNTFLSSQVVSNYADSTGRIVVKFTNLNYTISEPKNITFRGNISTNINGYYNSNNSIQPYTATLEIDMTSSNVAAIVGYNSKHTRLKNTVDNVYFSGGTTGSVNRFLFN